MSASIKLEPGVAHQVLASAAATLGTYFKPHVPAEINPQEGFERCPVCQSYFQDNDESRNAHLTQHKDRVFIITIPSDICVVDIEEACGHFARIGFKKDELQKKVLENQLIKYPTSLQGFSCNICLKFNGSKKSAMEHIKEDCKAAGSKEDRALHLLPFCRGCNTKFSSEAELTAHTALGKNACFPSPMTLNKIYDTVVMAAPPTPAVVAKKKQAELVKVKQEKQLEIKQEQLAANIPPAINQFVTDQRNACSGQAFQQFGPPQPSVSNMPMPSSEEMRRALAQAGVALQPLQHMQPPVQPYHQMHPPQQMMMPPQMQPPMQMPPQSLSPFPSYQQNFTAPPLLPPLPNHQQFAPEFQPQPVPSPQYSRSPTPTNQAATRPMRSLSSHLLGQISQEPKQRRQMAGIGSNGGPVQPPSPILPPLTTSRKVRKESKLTMVVPPPPVAPLNQDVWEPIAPIQQPVSLPVLQPSTSFKGSARPEACQKAQCEWTDAHAAFCSKPAIMEKCGQKLCSASDKHRTDYIVDRNRQIVYNCEKLKFYCNTAKTQDGGYSTNDTMTPAVPTRCNGQKEQGPGVTEGKQVSMRLLRRQKNPNIPDPRLQPDYCVKPAEPVRKLPGTGSRHPPNPKLGISKEQVEWSRDKMVVSYSAITGQHVQVEGFGCNPHIVEEEEDELEVVNEVQADDDDVVEVTDGEMEENPGSPVSPSTMKKRRKAAKRRS